MKVSRAYLYVLFCSIFSTQILSVQTVQAKDSAGLSRGTKLAYGIALASGLGGLIAQIKKNSLEHGDADDIEAADGIGRLRTALYLLGGGALAYGARSHYDDNIRNAHESGREQGFKAGSQEALRTAEEKAADERDLANMEAFTPKVLFDRLQERVMLNPVVKDHLLNKLRQDDPGNFPPAEEPIPFDIDPIKDSDDDDASSVSSADSGAGSEGDIDDDDRLEKFYFAPMRKKLEKGEPGSQDIFSNLLREVAQYPGYDVKNVEDLQFLADPRTGQTAYDIRFALGQPSVDPDRNGDACTSSAIDHTSGSIYSRYNQVPFDLFVRRVLNIETYLTMEQARIAKEYDEGIRSKALDQRHHGSKEAYVKNKIDREKHVICLRATGERQYLEGQIEEHKQRKKLIAGQMHLTAGAGKSIGRHTDRVITHEELERQRDTYKKLSAELAEEDRVSGEKLRIVNGFNEALKKEPLKDYKTCRCRSRFDYNCKWCGKYIG